MPLFHMTIFHMMRCVALETRMSDLDSSPTPPARQGGEQFTTWLTERTTLEAALDRTPESHTAVREALLDRAIELERLILNTPAHPRQDPHPASPDGDDAGRRIAGYARD